MNDQLILGNLYSLYRTVANSNPNSSIYSFPGFNVISTPESAWPNIAYDISGGEEAAELIQKISDEMGKIGMRPLVIDPGDRELKAEFKRQHYMPVDQWTAMYLNLTNEPKKVSLPHGYLVKEILFDFEEWTNIVSKTLFGGKRLDPFIFASIPADKAAFIGVFVNQQMVGTAMIYFDENKIAGFYMVCVVENFRKRNIGHLLMNYSLNLIREKKIPLCVLHATRSGLPLYRSLDFRESSLLHLYLKIK